MLPRHHPSPRSPSEPDGSYPRAYIRSLFASPEEYVNSTRTSRSPASPSGASVTASPVRSYEQHMRRELLEAQNAKVAEETARYHRRIGLQRSFYPMSPDMSPRVTPSQSPRLTPTDPELIWERQQRIEEAVSTSRRSRDMGTQTPEHILPPEDTSPSPVVQEDLTLTPPRIPPPTATPTTPTEPTPAESPTDKASSPPKKASPSQSPEKKLPVRDHPEPRRSPGMSLHEKMAARKADQEAQLRQQEKTVALAMITKSMLPAAPDVEASESVTLQVVCSKAVSRRRPQSRRSKKVVFQGGNSPRHSPRNKPPPA